MSKIPAYTVLNESIEDVSDVQTWENAYQSNILSSSNVSNYDVLRPNYSERNYDTLNGLADPPGISKLYDEMMRNNSQTQEYMNRTGMYPNYSPYPPQSNINIPSMQPQPPYNVGYPTNGFSPKDYSLAYSSNYVNATANIPVPLASADALRDAREQQSNVMMPNNNPIVIKHSEPIKEKFYEMDTMSCMGVYGHVHNCPMCMAYFNKNEKSLLVIIGFLLVIILVLLVILFKKGF